ncbi:conditioned medium-induced protein 4 [Halobaculum sp. D14]|uniref:conditioned medium-induced protein 4 n=1 Tax=Halobaculum sp. D14 TaxID=3421642 RepID=UPI003EBBEA7D
MDEKTAELREIFVDATGADTVTESQEETHGSLAEERGDAAERLGELVAMMRDRYEFDSSLGDDDLERVVRRYFDGDDDDDAIADALGVDADEVFDARMDLHLVRDADRDAPFDLDRLRSLHIEDAPMADRVDALDADEDAVAHFTAVVDADLESTRANDRFRDEFADLLDDADLQGGHTTEAHEDGLREATEDIETDVSF